MPASTNDKYKKVGASTVTTLSSPGKALGATSINVGSTTNFPTDTGIVIAIREVDTSGNLVAGTYTEWLATVSSGTSLAINASPVYGTDRVYAAGSTTQVYVPLSSYAHNTLVDGILTEHDQDGTHQSTKFWRNGGGASDNNLDSATQDGCYYYSPTTTNSPQAGSYGTILVTNSSSLIGSGASGYINQIAFIANGAIRYRQKVDNAAWSSWGSLIRGDATIQANTIAETTAANGVTIDSLNIKDGALNTNNSVVTTNLTDGCATPAKLYNPYKCRVFSNTAQNNIAQNVETRINFNAELQDNNGNFDAVTNYIYTAPLSGYYFVNAKVTWLNLTVGENIIVNVKVSGTTELSRAINAAAIAYGLDTEISGMVYMAAGQYLEVTTKHDGAGSTQDISSGQSVTYLQIHLMSV